jgi:subtilisin-like proprotein convertase family protein
MSHVNVAALAAILIAVGSPAAAVTYVGAGAAIPDNSFTLSTITVADNFKIGDVNVRLDGVGHNFSGDVQFYLTKGQTTVALFLNHGWNNYIQGTLAFDDEAAISITEFPHKDLPAAYRPYASLTAFDGVDAAGVWTLKAADISGGISGGYGAWSLDLTEQVVSGVPEPATWAMMITGFSLAGSALRRRRLALAVA